jgi:quercetin dioxygenase-like cupin family protein
MSNIHKFIGSQDDFRWEGVTVKEYQHEYDGVTRQVFIGPEEESNNFNLRYFRLEPGTHSHKESHHHEHGVLILHGRARVQLDDEFFEVGPNDAVFVPSNTLHQFTPIGDEPLGFLCVINPKDRE